MMKDNWDFFSIGQPDAKDERSATAVLPAPFSPITATSPEFNSIESTANHPELLESEMRRIC